MQSSRFDSLFETSQSLEDFVSADQDRSDCYKHYANYISDKFQQVGDTCEFCAKDPSPPKTFKASWRFEYVDSETSSVAGIVRIVGGPIVGSMVSSAMISTQKLRFSTMHIACPSCFRSIRLGQLLAKSMNDICNAVLIFSLLIAIGTAASIYFKVATLSIVSVLAIAIPTALTIALWFISQRYQNLGLVGNLAKIAKAPIILESTKFHRASY